MAVQTDSSRVSYSGNNSTVTPYAVPFKFIENEHLAAVAQTSAGVQTAVTLTGHTGAGTPNGGTVLTATAVPTTSTLTIFRSVPATQLTSYQEGGAFPAASHERALDKLTMLVQQNLRALAGSLRFREGDGSAAELAKIVSTLIGIGADGNPVCRTAEEVKSWLSLAAPILNFPTKVWEDDAERALAVPDFVGQVGTQRDTAGIYVASATTAGAWTSLTSNLPDGYLSADTAGRAKMANDYITLAKIAAGIFTADSTGRGKFANGFVADALLDATLDLSSKTLTMPSGFWVNNAPAGAILQTQRAAYTAATSLSGVITLNDSLPQNTDGSEILSLAITPIFSSSLIRATFAGWATCSTTKILIASLFRTGGANALATTATYADGSNKGAQLVFDFAHAPGAGASTYTVRVGMESSGGSFRMNGGASAGTRYFGGSSAATLTLQEIKQ